MDSGILDADDREQRSYTVGWSARGNHFPIETLATPGGPGVRKIASRFGVNFETVQRISRPFDRVGIVVA
jgi:hypothetical protein